MKLKAVLCSFQIQLSKPIPSSPSGEEQIVVIPVVHDLQNNTIQQADIQRSNVANTAAAAAATASMSSSPAAVVNAFLKRWSDMTPRTGESHVPLSVKVKVSLKLCTASARESDALSKFSTTTSMS